MAQMDYAGDLLALLLSRFWPFVSVTERTKSIKNFFISYTHFINETGEVRC
jgi:hypothetical protein